VPTSKPRTRCDLHWFASLERRSSELVAATNPSAVRARLAPQLVILGAGLDGRAWRIAEHADVDAFEVDHPASQQDKRDRVRELSTPRREVAEAGLLR
jgi:hypothetical protein